MWIGIVLIITVGGQLVTDSAPFNTEAECRQETARIVANAKDSKNVLAYGGNCIDATKSLTIKTPKASPPKYEPGA